MTHFSTYFLPIYFISFLVFAVFFRAFVLHQKTGVNAFAFSTSGPHGIIGNYFKLAPLGSLLVIIIHTLFQRPVFVFGATSLD